MCGSPPLINYPLAIFVPYAYNKSKEYQVYTEFIEEGIIWSWPK